MSTSLLLTVFLVGQALPLSQPIQRINRSLSIVAETGKSRIVEIHV
jgi:hypothetical protein